MRSSGGRLLVLAGNCSALVLARGVRGWARNLLSVSPALVSMTALLTGAAAAAIAGIGVVTAVDAQARQADVLDVYLAEGATPEQVAALEARLRADPRVAGVTLVTSDEALRRELRRPGVAGLVDAAGGNPFPASLEVAVASPAAVAGVATLAASDPAVDPAFSTSYDASAYARLRHMLFAAAAVAALVLAVLGFIAVTVTVTAIRAAAVARQAEVRVMRLVGAPWWAIRLPFVVEGGLTGTAAAILAVATAGGAAALVLAAGHSVFIELLPGVDEPRLGLVAGATVATGMLLGGGSGALALFRMP